MFKPRSTTSESGFEPKGATEAAKAVIRSLIDGRMLDESNWSVSLIRRKGTEHAFLIVEGIYQDKMVILRSDLFVNQSSSSSQKGPSSGSIFDRVFNPSKSSNSLAFISIKEINYEELLTLEKDCDYKSWPLDLAQAKRLLGLLESWGNGTVTYHIAGDHSVYSVSTSTTKHQNCVSWCEKILSDVDREYFKLGPTWKFVKIPSSRIEAAKEKNTVVSNVSTVNARERFFEQSDAAQLRPPLRHNIKEWHIVFKGGGVKGTAYGGAWAALNACIDLRTVTKVAGASAGAIACALVAVNYDPENLMKLLDTNFKQFLDGGGDKRRNAVFSLLQLKEDPNCSVVVNASRHVGTSLSLPCKILTAGGIFDGSYLRDWIEGLIFHQTQIHNCTFSELEIEREKGKAFRQLSLVSFNLNTQTTVVFNAQNTPNVVIADAVRASLSIPAVFVPYPIVIKQNGVLSLKEPVELYVDGGTLKNYPIGIFDKFEHQQFQPDLDTLGLCLYDRKTIDAIKTGNPLPRREIGNAPQALHAILSGILDAQDIEHRENQLDQSRSIYIDTCGVGTIDFDLTDEQKTELIESGWNAVCSHFDKNPNRPDFMSLSTNKRNKISK